MPLRSLKSWLMPVISQLFLSRARLLKLRMRAEKKRQSQVRPHTLHFFHQEDDPYSQLLATVLPKIQSRFDVTVETHWVSPPEDSAVPERALLKAYSEKDALRLAERFQIQGAFKARAAQPILGSTGSSNKSDALRKKMGPLLRGHHLLRRRVVLGHRSIASSRRKVE